MDQTRRLVQQMPDIKAIMAVHIYGHPCDMDPLLDLADRHGLFLIEDAAEAHGAEYCSRREMEKSSAAEFGNKGTWKKCGSFGHISVFSFYANKIVTTGEGGMVMTDHADLAAKARSLRNLAFQPRQRFLHDALGYNFRMTNLQAAVGLAQMERIDQLLERKIWQGEQYRHFLNGVEGLTLQSVQTYAHPVYWVNGILLNAEIDLTAAQMADRLQQKDIQTRPFFWPMHEQPVFKKMGLFPNERYPISENLARRGLYLPSGMALQADQIEQVCLQVMAIVKAAN
jgi:perosamine synthetase